MFVEAGIAVLVGVLLYGSKKAVIDPLLEFREVRKEISKDLVNYANVIANPGSGKQNRLDEAKRALREDASELKSAADDIPWFGLWAALRVVPKRRNVEEAKGNLIGLSNSVEDGDPLVNHEMREKAKSLLGL